MGFSLNMYIKTIFELINNSLATLFSFIIRLNLSKIEEANEDEINSNQTASPQCKFGLPITNKYLRPKFCWKSQPLL